MDIAKKKKKNKSKLKSTKASNKTIIKINSDIYDIFNL